MEDKEKRLRRQAKYMEKGVAQFKMNLVRATDGDIIEKLNTVGNKQGYVKNLIRKDIRGGGKNDQ